jgi:hypothetical protein
MRKFFLLTGMIGLAGIAAGAVAYVFGREYIEDALAGISSSKPKKKTETGAKQAAKSKTAAKKAADNVVISGSSGKFHRASCRYAASGGEEASRNEAVDRGLSPCGVCKP